MGQQDRAGALRHRGRDRVEVERGVAIGLHHNRRRADVPDIERIVEPAGRRDDYLAARRVRRQQSDLQRRHCARRQDNVAIGKGQVVAPPQRVGDQPAGDGLAAEGRVLQAEQPALLERVPQRGQRALLRPLIGVGVGQVAQPVAEARRLAADRLERLERLEQGEDGRRDHRCHPPAADIARPSCLPLAVRASAPWAA